MRLASLRRLLFPAVAVLAVVLAARAAAVPRATADTEPAYPCSVCIFELPLSPGAKLKILLGDPPVYAIDDLSPATRRLVLTEYGHDGFGLYVSNVDGSGRRRIGTGFGGVWSPDSKFVAYRRDPVPPFRCLGTLLWTVRFDGREEHEVADGCVGDIEWASDSRRIAFLRHGTGDPATLMIARSDGTEARAVAEPLSGSGLAWSPLSNRLAFATTTEATPPSGHGVSEGEPYDAGSGVGLEVVRDDGSQVANLPNAFTPAWAPDGTAFAFLQLARSRLSLRVASADGQALTTLRTGRFISAPKWLPDSRRVAYLDEGPGPRRGDVAQQVFAVERGGGPPRQLTRLRPGGTIVGYWFSPDASRLYVQWHMDHEH